MDQNLPQAPIDLQDIFLILRRRIRLIAFGAGFGVVLTAALLTLMRPHYTATTTLMVDSREEKVLNDAVVSPIRPSYGAIASETAVIVAPSVLKRVVEALDLIHDPDFKAVKRAPGPLGSARKHVAAFLGLGPREEKPSDEIIEVVELLKKSIEVMQLPNTNVLNIAVTSKDPHKSARIANALADAYLLQQLDGRYTATRRATEWLRARLDEHKAKLLGVEERYEQLKAKLEMLDKEGTTLEDKQLVRLNEELILARARTAEARARYQGVRQAITGAALDEKQLSEFVQSSLITTLRTQLAQVAREEDALNARFGTNHPSVVRVHAERRGLTSQIDAELRRAVAVLKNEFEVSSSREASLEQSLKAVAQKASGQKGEYVQLRELQRQVESDRAIYEAMLQRMKQAASQETWKSTDFRVVAEAVPPSTASQPKTHLLVFGSLSLGLGLGLGLAFLKELTDKTFKRGRDIEARLGVPHLVDVPVIPFRPGVSRSAALRYAAENIGSPFSDAMLGLMSSLQPAPGEAPFRSIMFTTPGPNEGKSVIAANYAQTVASSGAKVLLICADLRTPTIEWWGPGKKDLIDYLEGKCDIEAVIAREQALGLDMIPAARMAPNAATLLGSSRMQELLDWAKARYDLVVIDTVAVTTCLDSRMLARRIDATVVVVEWLKTHTDTAREAVDLLVKYDAHVVGAVLNKVDFAKAKLYGLATHA